jgi:replicative DNA helicase
MKQTIEMASAAYKNEEGIVGVPTGLRDLDDKLGGLHQSDLIIIAGRPSMGKHLLQQILHLMLRKNYKRVVKNLLLLSFH